MALSVVFVACCGCGAAARTDTRLMLAFTADPSTLDPALSKDVNSGTVVGYVYQTLVRYDEGMALVGDLADSWHVSADGLTYTFTLRSDARFASNRPVTAEAVAFSFRRVLEPRTGSGRVWVFDHVKGARAFAEGRTGAVEGIEAKDRTLTLRLERPFAPLLSRLSMPAASVVDPQEVEARPDSFGLAPSGSGPFEVREWVKDSHLALAPNPFHAPARPDLSGVVIRIITEPVTLTTEFRLGNLDVIGVPSAEHDALRADARYGALWSERPGLNVYFVGLNCEKGIFSDVRVRQAVARAVDRARIVQTVRRGQAVVAAGPLPPGIAGHDAAVEPPRHDPAQARRMLAEAGVKPGTVVRFLQSDNKANLEVTQMVAAYLADVGLEVKLVTHEWSTFKAKVDKGEFDAYYLNWVADYPDGENFLYPLFHSSRAGPGGNGPRYRSAEVDARIEASLAIAGAAQRAKAYAEIARIAVRDASRIFLFHKKDLSVRQPWLSGYVSYPVFNSDRLTRLSIDEARLGRS